MGIARNQRGRRIHVAIASDMDQTDEFVAAFPMGLFSLLGAEFIVIHRVIVLIKPQHHRLFIGRIVGPKQIAAIADENSLRIEKSIPLENLLAPIIEPLEPMLRGHVLDGLQDLLRVMLNDF